MARFFLYLSYNGTNYNGWQSQKNAPSVQDTLTRCLSLSLREDILLTGAGRTDAGVHASFFVVHLDSEKLINLSFANFLHKINSFLPDDIHVFDIRRVTNQAHARFDALSRTYEYFATGRKDPFKNSFQMKLPSSTFEKLNVEIMNTACEKLFDYNDFSCFAKTGTQTKTNICKIFEANVKSVDGELVFRIKADRFLRNMVRAIFGTLLDVGTQKISIEDFCRIIESKNRGKAGNSVPAKALFLKEIDYPASLFL